MDPGELQDLIATSIAGSLNDAISDIVASVKASVLEELANGTQPGGYSASGSGQNATPLEGDSESFPYKLPEDLKKLPMSDITELNVKTFKTQAWAKLKKTGREFQEGTLFYPQPQDKKDKEVIQTLLPLFVWRRVVTAKGHLDVNDIRELFQVLNYIESHWRHEINLSFVATPPGSKTKLTREEAKSLLIAAKGDPHAAQINASSTIDRRAQTSTSLAIIEAVRKQRAPIIITDPNTDKSGNGDTQAQRGSFRGRHHRGGGRGDQVGSDKGADPKNE
jgi:hypothetical protein